MSQAVSTSAGKTCGLPRVAAVWEIPRSTMYGRRRRESIHIGARPRPRKRRPKGPCGDERVGGVDPQGAG